MVKALQAGGRRRAGLVFAVVWLVSTLALAAYAAALRVGFDEGGEVALPAGLACTAALLWWLGGAAVPEEAAAQSPRTRRLVLAALGAAAVLLIIVTVFSRGLMFGIPVLAVALLAWLRPRLTWHVTLYALGLSVVAAVAGLGIGHITFISSVEWAVLQVPLVWLSLLAGWALLERAGLAAAGLGASLYLSRGAGAAVRGFGIGMLLAVPWALVNVVMGGAGEDAWAREWWRPLAALQPGIAEEAWGRVFLVALLYVVLRRAGRAGPALTAAVLVAAYWFAYLHTVDTPSLVSRVVSTVLIGTLFSLPLSYVWLRRGLETAIGFHFCMDAVRFGVAVLMNLGVMHG